MVDEERIVAYRRQVKRKRLEEAICVCVWSSVCSHDYARCAQGAREWCENSSEKTETRVVAHTEREGECTVHSPTGGGVAAARCVSNGGGVCNSGQADHWPPAAVCVRACSLTVCVCKFVLSVSLSSCRVVVVRTFEEVRLNRQSKCVCETEIESIMCACFTVLHDVKTGHCPLYSAMSAIHYTTLAFHSSFHYSRVVSIVLGM